MQRTGMVEDDLYAALDLYDRRNRFRIQCEPWDGEIAVVVTRRLTPGRRDPSTGKCVRELGLMRKYATHEAAQSDLESLIVDFDKRSTVPLSWDAGGNEESTNYTVMLNLADLAA